MNFKHNLFILLALFGLVLLAEDSMITKNVTGFGRSYKDAINYGLILAVEQHCGLTINATQRTSIMEAESSVSSTKQSSNEDKLIIADQIKNEMQKWCQGRIASYSVISEAYDEVQHQYTVNLSVQLYGKYVVGNARRRMVVAPFASNEQSISFMNVRISTSKWMGDLSRNLNTHLTQTRKFTMLDRDFDAEINKELARALESNASLADFAPRLNQKLATDYILVGQVLFRNVNPPMQDPYTKQILPNQELTMAEVHYRVLLGPTGQLKWSNTVKVNAMDALSNGASTIEDILSALAEQAATQITDEILSSILPFEIVTVTQNGTIVIGEGGKSLAVGEQLIVYALGETVTDTRTGEVLDEIEEEVGVVVISRVSEKLSYAKVISGDITKMKVGSRLRRPQVIQVGQPAQQPAAPATLTPNANGGVVTPF